MRLGAIACAAAAALMFMAGCGDPEQVTVEFGEVTAARKAEFVAAVAAAMKGFEDLDSQGVQVTVSSEEPVPQVTVRGGRISPKALENAMSVALTNMALKYPGIGFMATGDGGWRILMPDDMKIPATGDFEFWPK